MRLLQVFDSPKEVYEAKEEALVRVLGEEQAHTWLQLKASFDLEKEYAVLKDKGISFYHIWNEDYPEKLKEIADPPLALYVKGKLPEEYKRSVWHLGVTLGEWHLQAGCGTNLMSLGIN